MSGPNGDPDISADDGIITDEDDFGDEEYVAINSMLDQINSYLDDLEERNDALNGKLHELMESNRQARLEFRAQLFGAQTQEEQQQQQHCHAADGETSSASQEDINKDNEGSQMTENNI